MRAQITFIFFKIHQTIPIKITILPSPKNRLHSLNLVSLYIKVQCCSQWMLSFSLFKLHSSLACLFCGSKVCLLAIPLTSTNHYGNWEPFFFYLQFIYFSQTVASKCVQVHCFSTLDLCCFVEKSHD